MITINHRALPYAVLCDSFRVGLIKISVSRLKVLVEDYGSVINLNEMLDTRKSLKGLNISAQGSALGIRIRSLKDHRAGSWQMEGKDSDGWCRKLIKVQVSLSLVAQTQYIVCAILMNLVFTLLKPNH